jgi:uncharacterized membrane protein (UPF0127 family)
MRTALIFGVFLCLIIASMGVVLMRDRGVARDLVGAGAHARATLNLREGLRVTVEVADTPALRVQGLSGRAPFSDDEGMLFVFPEDGDLPIWMKDMNFALDIIWIDQAGRIVHIEPSVQPDSYPRIYKAGTPARYVLELRAGFADIRNVRVGDMTDAAKFTTDQ